MPTAHTDGPAAAEVAGPPDDDLDGVPPDVYARRWLILGVLTLSLVTVVIAVSSLNVAIPRIQEGLNASGTELQWILDSYALVFAGFLLPAGALGDRFGRKGALLVGLLIFGVASAVASTVDDPGQLIAARAVLGIGAALIMPATLSIIINSFPGHERPRAIAVWAAFAGVGGALGPISSGLLLDNFWWGSVFFANLPVILLLFVLAVIIVPTSKDPDGHALDPGGAVLSVVGLVALVFGVIEGPERGWTDPLTVGGFVVAALALAGFVAYELRVEHPMLDPRLFRNRRFSAGSATITLTFFNMFGMFFLLTQYLQFVRGYTPLEAGVRVLPSAFMMILVAPRSPRLVQRFGVRRLVRGGFLLTAVGFVLLGLSQRDTPYVVIALALMFTGGGMAALMPPASQLIVNSVPISKAGVGSAVNDVTREVGGALGIAVLGSVMASLYRSNAGFADAIADPAARDVAHESVGGALGVANRALDAGFIDVAVHDRIVTAAGDAFLKGSSVAFLVAAGVAVLTAVVVGRYLPVGSTVVPSVAPDDVLSEPRCRSAEGAAQSWTRGRTSSAKRLMPSIFFDRSSVNPE
jgi:EmrB/QacA subfamily drug resistance transporter